MCWQNYNTLKNMIIELTFFNMDYKWNTCEALTSAPDLRQIVQPERKKKEKIRGRSCECVLFAI